MSATATPTPVVNTDEALIEEGRSLVRKMSRCQLRLGRLALAFAPMGERGVQTGSIKRTELYAERIGIPSETLLNYRSVAGAWAPFGVGDEEFQYSILKALAPVVDKEAALKILRAKPEWSLKDAQDACADLMPNTAARANRTSFARGSNAAPRRTVPQDLNEVTGILRRVKLDMWKGEDRKVVDVALTQIENEVTRLRKEIGA